MGILFFYGTAMGGYGGIGRRAGFRFQWATVQVQVLLSARKRRFMNYHEAPFLFVLSVLSGLNEWIVEPASVYGRKSDRSSK